MEVLPTRRYMVLDLEACGTKKNIITELAYRIYENGKYVTSRTFIFSDAKKLNSHVSELTGITLHYLRKNGSPLTQRKREFIQKEIDSVEFVVLHDRIFDLRVLRRAGFKTDKLFVFDTKWFAEQLKENLPLNLTKLSSELGYSNRMSHRALSDVRATNYVFRNLLANDKFREARNRLQSDNTYKAMRQFNFLFYNN